MDDLFIKGDDFLEQGADHKTFGIHNGRRGWSQQIVIYGDEDLRDRILRLLKDDPDTPELRKRVTKLNGWINEHESNLAKARGEIETLQKRVIEMEFLKDERDEAAFALRAVLAGEPVRNADEIIARSEFGQVFGPTGLRGDPQ